ncbi:MFS transporter [Sphaerisporangium rhizosphaerae]|uniref:MFS transporter n=1 Tax=Sphaerisporangium rhizosphaerae TaxID=2269375 RepID=A0ABW2P4X8_9ACTN
MGIAEPDQGVIAGERGRGEGVHTAATVEASLPVRAVLREAGFRLFWTGQTISLIGSQVSLVALPLLAVLTLDAGPFEVGLLAALGRAPWLLFGLLAGALADRARRRPLLVAADLVRAAVLAWIPVAAWLGVLTVGQLYAVTFVVGTMTVLSEVAAQSFLPSLAAPAQLADGNGKLEVSRASAEAVGPGLGGVLVQAVTAPFAIVADVVSFLLSATLLGRLKVDERTGPDGAGALPGTGAGAASATGPGAGPGTIAGSIVPTAPGTPTASTSASATASTRASVAGSVAGEMREGLRFVLGHPLLRWNVLAAAVANFFGNILLAILVLYVLTELRLAPAVIGLVLGLGSLGAVLGAAVAQRLIRRAGYGPTLTAGLAVTAAGGLLLAPVDGPYALRVAWAVAALMLLLGGVPLFDVAVVTLRQLITPPRILGRANATMRFLVFGTMPLGALAGGLLGDHAGLRTAVLVAGAGLAVPVILVLVSPLARLRSHLPPSMAAFDRPSPITIPGGNNDH